MATTITKHRCPVCGKTEFPYANSYDICEFCEWEDEEFAIKHPDEDGGANFVSLNRARDNYREYGKLLSDEDEAAEDVYIKLHYDENHSWCPTSYISTE